MFEVMDKEPSLFALATSYAVLCAIAFLASRKRWWLGLLLLPAIGIFNNISELRDPYVGPAILHEAGRQYVTMSYGMLFTALALLIVVALRQRHVQRAR